MTRAKNSLLGCLVAAALFAAPGEARASVPGSTLYAWGSQIWVKFVGYSAAYTNDLYYFSSWGASPQYLFTNKTTATGQQFLVTNAALANQELIFGIYVREARRWYYSGDPSRNQDAFAHATISSTGASDYTTGVGFEDLWAGGDQDYNDLKFEVMNANTTVTPEPVTMVLLGSGLLGLGGAAARKRRAARPLQAP